MNKRPSLLLLDTGAGVNLMSSIYADKIKARWNQTNDVKLKGVTGTSLSVLGKTDPLPVMVGGLECKESFVVVHSLNDNLILGIQFLNNNNVIIDYNKLEMRSGKYTTPLIKLNINKINANLVTTEDIKCNRQMSVNYIIKGIGGAIRA